jgi:hypothetical protein
MAFASDGMSVPGSLKGFAVQVDFVEKEIVKKPQMGLISAVQEVTLFQVVEECSPCSSKLGSNFQP